MARFSSNSVPTSARTFSTVRTACAPSISIERGTFGPQNDRNDRKSLNTNPECTAPSGPNVTWHALMVGRMKILDLVRSGPFVVFRMNVLLVHGIIYQFSMHCDIAFLIFFTKHL